MIRSRRVRRLIARYDTRAPLTEAYASQELARFYAAQVRAAVDKMRAHDRLPQPVRTFDKVAGNDRVAWLLKESGCRTAAEAEQHVRAMLERFPKPERHAR